MLNTVGVLQRDAPLISLNPNIPVTAWTGTAYFRSSQSLQSVTSVISVNQAQHLPGHSISSLDQRINLSQSFSISLESQIQRNLLDNQSELKINLKTTKTDSGSLRQKRTIRRRTLPNEMTP